MNCEKCEYWDIDQESCGAFECNGLDCPPLPCEQWWVFTFGCGHPHVGTYVKIRGTYNQAREKMVAKYGLNWAFQYFIEEWEKHKADPVMRHWLEVELEVIE